jgi:hypothetical protein
MVSLPVAVEVGRQLPRVAPLESECFAADQTTKRMGTPTSEQANEPRHEGLKFNFPVNRLKQSLPNGLWSQNRMKDYRVGFHLWQHFTTKYQEVSDSC